MLGKWRTLFYPDGEKHIPEKLSEVLDDPLSLAVWYMDDGYYSLKDKASMLYLGRVSAFEANIVKKTLEENFGLTSRVYDKGVKGFAIYFPVKETKKLHQIIRKHILPMFSYKLLNLSTP